jgi:hypothetical protein
MDPDKEHIWGGGINTHISKMARTKLTARISREKRQTSSGEKGVSTTEMSKTLKLLICKQRAKYAVGSWIKSIRRVTRSGTIGSSELKALSESFAEYQRWKLVEPQFNFSIQLLVPNTSSLTGLFEKPEIIWNKPNMEVRRLLCDCQPGFFNIRNLPGANKKIYLVSANWEGDVLNNVKLMSKCSKSIDRTIRFTDCSKGTGVLPSGDYWFRWMMTPLVNPPNYERQRRLPKDLTEMSKTYQDFLEDVREKHWLSLKKCGCHILSMLSAPRKRFS